MLNAFRHQRKKRWFSISSVFEQWAMCSTPSGIKGRNAARRADEHPQPEVVLNAFRHQRKKRGCFLYNGTYILSAQRLPASKEETLGCRGGVRGGAGRAQRLPASKEETLECKSSRSARAGTCSTPSGIKGRNAYNGEIHRALADIRAQRLPASKEETRPVRNVLGREPGVLNAFRHQRKKRGQSWPGGSWGE